MDREQILLLLKQHRTEIREMGIRSLSLFGSVAREEAGPDSDVDLLVEFSPPYTFDRYIKAKFFLEDLLGHQVDLVMHEALKPRARSSVEKDSIRVA